MQDRKFNLLITSLTQNNVSIKYLNIISTTYFFSDFHILSTICQAAQMSWPSAMPIFSPGATASSAGSLCPTLHLVRREQLRSGRWSGVLGAGECFFLFFGSRVSMVLHVFTYIYIYVLMNGWLGSLLTGWGLTWMVPITWTSTEISDRPLGVGWRNFIPACINHVVDWTLLLLTRAWVQSKAPSVGSMLGIMIFMLQNTKKFSNPAVFLKVP